MKRQKIRLKETVATVISDYEYIPEAEKEIFRQRKYIEDFIRQDPYFQIALQPYDVPQDAPEIVRKMAEASSRVGVGPMASVAGALAEYAVKAMVAAGAKQAIFDNGGDIAMYISQPVVVSIYSGKEETRGIGLRIKPRKGIIGICTSSATVGNSLSFGYADVATVLSTDVMLADAAATALGNSIIRKEPALIKKALARFMIEGIDGMIVMTDELVGLCGDLPEIVPVNFDNTLITKG